MNHEGTDGLALMTDGQQALPMRAVETAASAVASQAAALVQARYAIALRRPRNFDQARAEILKECRRPTFAESAVYRKPIGNTTITGASIRFAEAAARAMGNIQVDTFTVFDDLDRRIVRVAVTELESNASYSRDLTLQKVVERKFLRKGQSPISRRTNSTGEITYLVEATEDDLAVKEAAQVSKVLRTLLLRFVPGDLIEEALEQCARTVADKAAQDPDAEKRKILDAFAGLRVMPVDLEQYLGHKLDQLAPKNLVELRAVYAAIRDGESSWQEALAAKLGEQPRAPAADGGGSPKSLADLAARAQEQAAKGADQPVPEQPHDGTQGAPPAAAAPGTSSGQPPSAIAGGAAPVPESRPPRDLSGLESDDPNAVVAAAAKVLDQDALQVVLGRFGAKRGVIGLGLSARDVPTFIADLRDVVKAALGARSE